MDDRRQDEGRNDRTGRDQRAGRYTEQGRYSDEYGGQGEYDESQRYEGQRGVTTRSRQGTEMERTSGGGSGSQGDMRGYVLPYRYYGPGYRGVGYYAVFYQGPTRPASRGTRASKAVGASSTRAGRVTSPAAGVRATSHGRAGWVAIDRRADTQAAVRRGTSDRTTDSARRSATV